MIYGFQLTVIAYVNLVVYRFLNPMCSLLLNKEVLWYVASLMYFKKIITRTCMRSCFCQRRRSRVGHHEIFSDFLPVRKFCCVNRFSVANALIGNLRSVLIQSVCICSYITRQVIKLHPLFPVLNLFLGKIMYRYDALPVLSKEET